MDDNTLNGTELNASDPYDYDYDSRELNVNETDYGLTALCPMSNNSRVESAVRPYLHPLICALGLAGNGLVLLTYAFSRRPRSPTDVYLLNVAVSDLLFVAALPLITYNELWAWPMGTAACKLLRGAYSVNLYSCMLLLACVAADRYLAIVHAPRRLRLRSLLYSRAVCGAVWVLALACSLPTLLYHQAYRPSHMTWVTGEGEDGGGEDGEDGGGGGGDPVCSLRFSDPRTARLMRVLVPGAQMAVGFLLPLAVMVFCYAQVVARLLRAHTFQRHRAVRVVLAVVAAFLACHLPYNAALLCQTLGLFREQSCREAEVEQVVLTVTESLAFLHCCVNPLLYAFLGVKFRSNLKRLGARLWGPRGRRAQRGLASRATSDSCASSRRSVTSTSFDI
ncbi:C-C chemokine receptor type 6-like [Gadus chalcogrammus]|uniref:C-C chemokine receptor type 6-like n=1 Tax=Gadus chalcogrammus TaxID=1042646 RepID=UPI0024C49C72|nr:C-C chemokine receptor type 6-like [Gadus chalcogrammus]